MRLHYYRFPEDSSPEDRLKEGCGIILKTGETVSPEFLSTLPDELVEGVDDTLGGITITYAKQLLKKYGGCAFTEHCDRDGSIFEVTEITLSGNNSRFRYNRHL